MRIQRRRQPERGMTLLEMMIVLAIIALVMGLIVGPSVIRHFTRAKERIANIAVHKFADEAYPEWAATHPDKPCPDQLEDLAELMNQNTTKDPWGASYKMYCGVNLPLHAKGIAIWSLGPDGKDATSDDIKSWE